ncbi:hypothetical protein [Shewanella atlantica]|uniref:Uncharacterized protein n=1 Tax=Shewanella atlantica TaxID=271099 RepID=A0A431VVB2_9GAMM|nr:hypothetical protein [Shewanella atlantica]RTR27208.1 hypothetical protein EKG39_20680 [Shewanella atlantica]
MSKSIATVLFSLALGLVADHLNGVYQFSQLYGTAVSGLAFLTLYCICGTFCSSLVYKISLGQAADRFFGPCKTDTWEFLANAPMIIMSIAYSSKSIDSFLWVALSIAIGDLYFFKYRTQNQTPQMPN